MSKNAHNSSDLGVLKSKEATEMITFFEKLDALEFPEKIIRKFQASTEVESLQKRFRDDANKKQKANSKKEFYSNLQTAFSNLKACIDQQPANNIATLFYSRMLATKELIAQEKITELKFFINLLTLYIKKRKMSKLGEFLRDLSNYVDSHTLDIDNSLIGLRVNSSTLLKYYKASDVIENNDQKLDNFLEKEEGSNLASLPSESLLNIEGSFSPRVNLNYTYQNGELVIYFVDRFYFYGRYIGANISSSMSFSSSSLSSSGGILSSNNNNSNISNGGSYAMLKICTSPTESSFILLEKHNLFPLHEAILKIIKQKNKNVVKTLVKDPIEDWFTSISSAISNMLKGFFKESFNFNDEWIKYLKTLSSKHALTCTDLEHSVEIITLTNSLMKLNESPPKSLYDEINHMGRTQFEDFLSICNLDYCYQITKENSISQLSKILYSKVAIKELHSYLTKSKSIVEQILHLQNSYLNGTKKKDLTTWWLSKIYQECKKFLEDRGYDSSAIPDDYIANPADVVPIKANLQLIEEILNPKEDVHNIKAFIKRLVLEIYEKITEFISSSLYVIKSIVDSVDRKYTLSDFSTISKLHDMIIHVQSIINNNESNNQNSNNNNIQQSHQNNSSGSDLNNYYSTTRLLRVIDLMKDIQYLYEMKDLDETSFLNDTNDGQKGLIMTTVVPISGLIMSSFYRKENVLRTILELWDVKPKKPTTDVNDNNINNNNATPLSRTVSPPTSSTPSSPPPTPLSPTNKRYKSFSLLHRHDPRPSTPSPPPQENNSSSNSLSVSSSGGSNNNNSNVEKGQYEKALSESRTQFRDSILELTEESKWDEIIRLATLAKQQENIQLHYVRKSTVTSRKV